VQRGEHVDEPLAHEPALGLGLRVPLGEDLPHDVPLDEVHHVERLAKHGRVLAEVPHPRHRHVGAAQRGHDAVLAAHVVRGRQDVAQRRTTQHDRAAGGVDAVREVALATGDEGDLGRLPGRVAERLGEVGADDGRVRSCC
jgi:hypothetical protein